METNENSLQQKVDRLVGRKNILRKDKVPYITL